MAYTQQYNIMLSAHHLNPDSCEQFVTDVIEFVCRWQSTHNILLCLDANDSSTDSTNKGIECIIDETALINLHHHRHPQTPSPATYNRGSQTIDYCLGTKGFTQALTGTWMLPFGLPSTLSGNHQTMGIEFDHNILFGHKLPQLKQTYQRGLHSNAYPTVRKYNDLVAAECAKQNLYKLALQLSRKYLWSPEDHQQLKAIDITLMKILTKADQRLAHYRNSPWSPALHQAFLTHRFWTIRLSQERTHCDFLTVLKTIEARMTTPPATTGTVSSNLRKAQHTIREIKQEAAQRQEAYLQELLDAAQQNKDKAKQKLILHL